MSGVRVSHKEMTPRVEEGASKLLDHVKFNKKIVFVRHHGHFLPIDGITHQTFISVGHDRAMISISFCCGAVLKVHHRQDDLKHILTLFLGTGFQILY